MTAVVFIGPTLGPADGRGRLDADYRPPASQGDVYRAALGRPRAIGIVDGYFESVPAVWHKEILWAMAQGIHVLGSASMGALRAAELAAFGMDGVGWIFAQYRDGALEDDDEVAVLHGPAGTGYVALSEAMVNIRRTLAAAASAGVLDADAAAMLTGIAKALFYKDRSYAALLDRAGRAGLAAAAIDRFAAWLPGGRIDQKRLDALAMLRLMRDRLAAGLPPKQVRYHFEPSRAWDAARRAIDRDGAASLDRATGRA